MNAFQFLYIFRFHIALCMCDAKLSVFFLLFIFYEKYDVDPARQFIVYNLYKSELSLNLSVNIDFFMNPTVIIGSHYLSLI